MLHCREGLLTHTMVEERHVTALPIEIDVRRIKQANGLEAMGDPLDATPDYPLALIFPWEGAFRY